MSSIYTSGVQLGVLPTAGTIYTSGVQLGVVPTNTEIDSGAIDVTLDDGATISNLVVGTFYSIEATGGPWRQSVFGWTNNHAFAASNDGGSTWSGVMGGFDDGATFGEDNPAWSTALVNLDGLRARMHWRATTTSIKIQVGDSPGAFADNSGALGWLLREGLGVFTSGVRLG